MEVKVGIIHSQRDVVVETDAGADEVEQRVTEALANGTLLKLTDTKGRSVLIPPATIAYVDLGNEHARPVGFGVV